MLYNAAELLGILYMANLYFTCIQRPMLPDHGTHEENLARHHGGMHKDGLTDGQTDRLNPFQYSSIPLRQSGE